MRKLKSSDDSHKEERYPTIRLKTPAPIVSSKSKFFPKKPDEPSAEGFFYYYFYEKRKRKRNKNQ